MTVSEFGKHTETRTGKKLDDENLFPLAYMQAEFGVKINIKYFNND